MEEQSTAQESVVDEQSPALQDETEVTTTEDDTQHETDAPVAEADPAEATPEAPVSEPTTEAEVVEEEPEWTPTQIEAPNVQAPNMQQFVDAEGNLDVANYQAAQAKWASDLVAAAVSQSTQAVKLQSDYEKEWYKAEDRYPELKKNRQLKDMVQAIHANSAQPGFKYLSPLKAAEQLFALRGEAKADGMKAAQQSRTVQAAASLGNPNPPAPAQSTDRAKQLKDQMRTGGTRAERQSATHAYIGELLKSGRI